MYIAGPLKSTGLLTVNLIFKTEFENGYLWSIFFIVKVLIIDSDPGSNGKLKTELERNDVEVFKVETISEGIEIIERELLDAIVCNVILPDGTIGAVQKAQVKYNRNAPVVVTADLKNIQKAVDAVKNGAYSFIKKPYFADDLLLKIEKAIEFKRLELEAQNLRGERDLIYHTEGFICESPNMIKVLDLVKKVAPTDSTVMLLGETGTGKELVSGSIHYNSKRADKAFVKVNCAALPMPLFESEVFGHEKGAFTGADKLRIGRFEQANGGSILLDEITELNVETQVKLLRVIQEKEFERIGSSRPIKLDVRFISATNRDLSEEVEQGRFRKDLYYRLNVFSIHIPPLREREEDIMPLAGHFLRKFAGEFNKPIEGFAPDAEELLRNHQWPGNVRELQNTIERAVLLAENHIITANELFFEKQPEEKPFRFVKIPKEGLSLSELEEDLIRQALRATNYVQKEAAKLLKMTPRTLNYKIGKYGIVNPNWPKHTKE